MSIRFGPPGFIRRRPLIWFVLGLCGIGLFVAGKRTQAQVDHDRLTDPEQWGYLGFRRAYVELAGQGSFHVGEVLPGGPAEKAGLLPEDSVIAVNGIGFRFETFLEQCEAFAWVRPGDRIELTILRGDTRRQVELVADTMPENLVRRWRQILQDARHVHQAEILRLLGRGDGVIVDVTKEAASGRLEFKAEGHPPQAFEHLEPYLRKFPPLLIEPYDRLKPGDELKVRVTSRGDRVDLVIMEGPAYLRDWIVPVGK